MKPGPAPLRRSLALVPQSQLAHPGANRRSYDGSATIAPWSGGIRADPPRAPLRMALVRTPASRPPLCFTTPRHARESRIPCAPHEMTGSPVVTAAGPTWAPSPLHPPYLRRGSCLTPSRLSTCSRDGSTRVPVPQQLYFPDVRHAPPRSRFRTHPEHNQFFTGAQAHDSLMHAPHVSCKAGATCARAT